MVHRVRHRHTARVGENVRNDEDALLVEDRVRECGRGTVRAFRHHADAGLDNQLAFLDAALDWVAGNTPRDRETRYLEARVTACVVDAAAAVDNKRGVGLSRDRLQQIDILARDELEAIRRELAVLGVPGEQMPPEGPSAGPAAADPALRSVLSDQGRR